MLSVNFFKNSGIAHRGIHCVAVEAGNSKKIFKRSYVRTQLLCQLRKGKKYKLEFFIKSRYDVLDSIGVYFTSYDFLFEKQILYRIIPNVYLTNATLPPERLDTNWQKVSLEYIATGTELYLTLGNFSKRDMRGITNTSSENDFLVFFDDISLVPQDPNEKICDDWQNTRDDIYAFNARHQFLDTYIKTYVRNPPDPPKVGKTILFVVDTLSIPDVFFDVNRSELNKKSFKVLDSLSASLKREQIDSMVVQGYTDSTGSLAHNEKLSFDRASSVANYINERLLLDRKKVIARGYGSESPVADNRTSVGRQLNRRVEIFIYIRQ